MLNSPIIDNYASALLAIAVEEKQVKNYLESFLQLKELHTNVPQFFAIIASDKYELNDRIDLISNNLKEFPELIVNTLLLLIDKRLIVYIDSFLNHFIKMAGEMLAIKDLIIYSAKPLPESTIRRIEKIVAEKLDARIYSHNEIDPSLIAGVKIGIDSISLDETLKSRIMRLKETLSSER